MTLKSSFWPLDYEIEDEIYDNLAWDLPGLRKRKRRGDARPGQSSQGASGHLCFGYRRDSSRRN